MTSISLLLANGIQELSALKCFFFFATCVYLWGNLPVRLATQRKSLRKLNLPLLATTCESVWPGLYIPHSSQHTDTCHWSGRVFSSCSPFSKMKLKVAYRLMIVIWKWISLQEWSFCSKFSTLRLISPSCGFFPVRRIPERAPGYNTFKFRHACLVNAVKETGGGAWGEISRANHPGPELRAYESQWREKGLAPK